MNRHEFENLLLVEAHSSRVAERYLARETARQFLVARILSGATSICAISSLGTYLAAVNAEFLWQSFLVATSVAGAVVGTWNPAKKAQGLEALAVRNRTYREQVERLLNRSDRRSPKDVTDSEHEDFERLQTLKTELNQDLIRLGHPVQARLQRAQIDIEREMASSSGGFALVHV